MLYLMMVLRHHVPRLNVGDLDLYLRYDTAVRHALLFVCFVEQRHCAQYYTVGFAGKVTYGERRKAGGGSMYQGHAAEISQSVKELYELERRSQNSFIGLRFNTPVRS